MGQNSREPLSRRTVSARSSNEPWSLGDRSNEPPMRSSDSWIQISSHSSSSSSSPRDNPPRPTPSRRRRSTAHHLSRFELPAGHVTGADTSSQDEYEESESESDRVMTSSNEGLSRNVDVFSTVPNDYSRDNFSIIQNSEGECFTPQPNAFSYLPETSSVSHVADRIAGHEAHLPTSATITSSTQRRAQGSMDTDRNSQLTCAPHRLSPSLHHADHDAVLRASLSTLLSCAAAARSLPKSRNVELPRPAQGLQPSSNRVEASTLCFIPESEVLARESVPKTAEGTDLDTAATQTDKGKRKAARSGSKDRHVAKKTKTAMVEHNVSPTLLTWAVSAGVIVLVSTISFCAGYKIGRNTGHTGSDLWGSESMQSCGKEAVRGAGGFKRKLLGDAASAAVGA